VVGREEQLRARHSQTTAYERSRTRMDVREKRRPGLRTVALPDFHAVNAVGGCEKHESSDIYQTLGFGPALSLANVSNKTGSGPVSVALQKLGTRLRVFRVKKEVSLEVEEGLGDRSIDTLAADVLDVDCSRGGPVRFPDLPPRPDARRDEKERS